MTETTVPKRILDFLTRYPGAHVRELERQLGLSNHLAAYHLTRLEKRRLVTAVENGGYTRYVTRRGLARLSRDDIPFVCLMRRPPALRITVLLLAKGERTHGAISRDLGLARASTSYHLTALREAGILDVRAGGRERHYRIAHPAYARRMLDQFHPTPGSLDRFSRMWDDLFG